jgi:hypothetical protein
VRPHQALGYKTPEQFYQDWLTKHHVGKGGIVRYVLTQYRLLTRPPARDRIRGRPDSGPRPVGRWRDDGDRSACQGPCQR